MSGSQAVFAYENVGKSGFDGAFQAKLAQVGNEPLRCIRVDPQLPGAHVQNLTLIFVQGEDEGSAGAEKRGCFPEKLPGSFLPGIF